MIIFILHLNAENTSLMRGIFKKGEKRKKKLNALHGFKELTSPLWRWWGIADNIWAKGAGGDFCMRGVGSTRMAGLCSHPFTLVKGKSSNAAVYELRKNGLRQTSGQLLPSSCRWRSPRYLVACDSICKCMCMLARRSSFSLVTF